MNAPAKFLARIFLFASICALGASCSDTDPFFNDNPGTETEEAANAFDFSTSRRVDLIVDYSDFEANIPVFFSVYNTNPFVNENTVGEYIDESIKPLFSGYTAKNGRFDATITLPAYAKRLHIVTGNFLVGLRRNVVLVQDGKATLKVEDPLRNVRQNAPRRVPGTGVSTDNLDAMYNLSWEVGSNGTKYNQIYKEWVTPLGTWNSASGRPDYLLNDRSQAEIDDLVARGLMFTEEEFTGMYETACAALNSGTSFKDSLAKSADLTLVKASEVSITALGSSTCWNSALGYYYYTGDAPTNKMDLNIIMLYPNTQDGMWPRGSYPNNKYNGNIGTTRGDAIQLMYYPTKADGSLDLQHGTTTFPAGTKIGFILKANSWGCLGSDYAVNGSSYASKINIWGSTTQGLSYAVQKGSSKSIKIGNPNGDARSAKFPYTSPNGEKRVIVSFEDCCDDTDYDDLMFALNPADAFAFDDKFQIESRKSIDWDVWAFEDLWPSKGDYDMNDAVVEVRHEMEYYVRGNQEGDGMFSNEAFYLTTYRNHADYDNGLGFKIAWVSGFSTKNDLFSIYLKKILPGQKEPVPVAKYTNNGNKYYFMPEFQKLSDYVFLLTNNINLELGASYVVEFAYTKSFAASPVLALRPFIYRPANSTYNQRDFRWEVHIPKDQPVDKGNESLYGTKDDRSTSSTPYTLNPKELHPFAFQMKGVSISAFYSTILNPANEGRAIDEFFDRFSNWVKTKGAQDEDWYMYPVAETESTTE